MGVSDPCNKEPVMNFLNKIIKKYGCCNILDLGMGYGEFGKLIKEKYGESVNLEGVEVWKKYEHANWKYYDKINICDIRTFVSNIDKKYDIVLFIDVLEHFNKKDGVFVLENIKKIAKNFVLISTPITPYPQDCKNNNPYEKHKYFWSENMLIQEGCKLLFKKRVYTYSDKPKYAELGVFYIPINT